MPTDIIKKRIGSLTPEYREFILSDYSLLTSEIFTRRFNFDEDARIVFENGLTMYLLLFISKFELIEFLIMECHIPINRAPEIVNEIINGLPKEMVRVIDELSLTLRVEKNDLITRKVREQVLAGSQKHKLHSYLYVIAGRGIEQIAKKYDIDKNPELYEKLITTIGDIVLGFYRVADTVPLLQQELGLSPRTAAILGADVLDFLAPLSDPTWQSPHSELAEEDVIESPAVLIPQATPVPTAPYTQIFQDLVSQPAPVNTTQNYTAPPAPLTPNPQSTSLHFEPVHTAQSQDTLRQPLSQIPSYNNQPTPHTPPTDIETPPQWGRY